MFHKAQQGIALISALLIVAIATTITVSLTFDQTLVVKKTAYMLDRAQSTQYILGLEDWVQNFLIKDAKDSEIDSLTEDWATKIPPLPVARGYLSGYLDDEQAKVNLNGLLSSPETLDRFRLLCEHLGVETEFIPALLDWLDSDLDIRYPDGAEDDVYSSLTPAYRSANRLMTDVSELLLVKSMSDDIYNELLPFITVLPEATNLNVNTLSKEVFLALDKSLNDSQYEQFIELRDKDGFTSVSDMIKKLKINIDEKGLSVGSDYFSLNGLIVQGESQTEFVSLIHRNKQQTKILQRSLGF
ncbi:MAG: type II secretion system minor pseudopilin GspK [Gammaproteobacteria bacterium]|nr:type II secretion system minor pseudopilin GspK [Gammaproteobacteria bacterium]